MQRVLTFCATVAFATASTVAVAEIISVASSRSVPETVDALEAAATEAGLGIAARIDHAAGGTKAGMALPPGQVLIFGNPEVGTPAMQADPRAGLYLPLRVAVYEDADGKVWLIYEDPAAMMEGLDISADAPFVQAMTGALAKLTATAAGD